jgi:hypothetical protein
MVGEKRLDTFGSLVIRDGSGPVEFCLPLMPAHVADSCRRCPIVHAGSTLMRLGRMAERHSAGGQHFCGGGVRLRGAALGRCHPLAGGSGPALAGVQISFPERLKPRADGIEPGVDLPPTALRGRRLAVHAL